MWETDPEIVVAAAQARPTTIAQRDCPDTSGRRSFPTKGCRCLAQLPAHRDDDAASDTDSSGATHLQPASNRAAPGVRAAHHRWIVCAAPAVPLSRSNRRFHQPSEMHSISSSTPPDSAARTPNLRRSRSNRYLRTGAIQAAPTPPTPGSMRRAGSSPRPRPPRHPKKIGRVHVGDRSSACSSAAAALSKPSPRPRSLSVRPTNNRLPLAVRAAQNRQPRTADPRASAGSPPSARRWLGLPHASDRPLREHAVHAGRGDHATSTPDRACDRPQPARIFHRDGWLRRRPTERTRQTPAKHPTAAQHPWPVAGYGGRQRSMSHRAQPHHHRTARIRLDRDRARQPAAPQQHGLTQTRRAQSRATRPGRAERLRHQPPHHSNPH